MACKRVCRQLWVRKSHRLHRALTVTRINKVPGVIYQKDGFLLVLCFNDSEEQMSVAMNDRMIYAAKDTLKITEAEGSPKWYRLQPTSS